VTLFKFQRRISGDVQSALGSLSGTSDDHGQLADSVLKSSGRSRQAILYKAYPAKANSGTLLSSKGLQNGLKQGNNQLNLEIKLNDISAFLESDLSRDVTNGVDGQFMQYSELQFACRSS